MRYIKTYEETEHKRIFWFISNDEPGRSQSMREIGMTDKEINRIIYKINLSIQGDARFIFIFRDLIILKWTWAPIYNYKEFSDTKKWAEFDNYMFMGSINVDMEELENVDKYNL